MEPIRVVFAPKVCVIGRPAFDAGAMGDFLADAGASSWTTDSPNDAQAIAEVGGRTCYNSFRSPRPGGNSAYLAHIIESGHGRILEHCNWTLLISGVSRDLAQQFYTHTVGFSKSMRSQRYVDESDCAFVVPPDLVSEVEEMWKVLDANDWCHPAEFSDWGLVDAQVHGLHWLRTCVRSLQAYREQCKYLGRKFADTEDVTQRRKRARQAARYLLPGAVETVICLTANARALRNFLEQRGSPFADAEIRRLAVAIYRIMLVEAPDLFADFRVVAEPGCPECLDCEHHKV